MDLMVEFKAWQQGLPGTGSGGAEDALLEPKVQTPRGCSFICIRAYLLGGGGGVIFRLTCFTHLSQDAHLLEAAGSGCLLALPFSLPPSPHTPVLKGPRPVRPRDEESALSWQPIFICGFRASGGRR